MGQIEERLGAIAKLIQTDQDATDLRSHVNKVLESPAFASSRRSGQFLQYVVDRAVAQQTSALKERTIGIEVFHRPPDYDTGEDAIVRVTASDVRRRLAQHYGSDGRASEFRISLPPGSYAPEVHRDVPALHISPMQSVTTVCSVAPISEGAPSLVPVIKVNATSSTFQMIRRFLGGHSGRLGSIWVVFFFALGAIALISLGASWKTTRARFFSKLAPAPWSLLFSSSRPLLIVMADPDLNEIQALTGKYISLADYAAGRLGCDTLQPKLESVCQYAFRGDKSATVDVTTVAKIAALAGRYSSNVEPLEARSLRLQDLQSDRNVVLLGSRVSDPWVDLYRDKLDFYVAHDQRSGMQVVYNAHRRPGEQDEYIPTAGPYGFGDNFTLISFLHNLHGNGYAMLISGATHEGIDAAINFIVDADGFRAARRECGIASAETPFQMLVKFRMMAGSPLKVVSTTCHQMAP